MNNFVYFRDAEVRRTYFNMTEAQITDSDLEHAIGGEFNSPAVSKFLELFKERYYDNWICFTDQLVHPWETNIPDAEPEVNDTDRFLRRFGSRFKTTANRYLKLIELYEANEQSLLNKIGNSSVVKFNDTPQDDSSTIDGFVTTITTNEVSTDPGEMINRLKNIENNYSDVYNDWLNEFSSLFGEAI